MSIGRKTKSRKRVPWIKVIKRLLLFGCFFGVGTAAGLVAIFYYYSMTLPAIGPLLKGYDPPQTTRILAKDGTVIRELFTERRTVIPYARFPKMMINAVVASEDADFWKHEGIDYRGIVRSVYRNLMSGRRAQGGSTITQQVARTFFLTQRKTYVRKIREALLTKEIEERLNKEQILYLYLNQIPFGHARYGVYEATRFYFGKEIEELTLAEAALLAGIPKAPTHYSPITHPEAAKKRRAYVIGEMLKHKMISKKAAKRANNAPINLSKRLRVDNSLAPEAASYAVKELTKTVDINLLKHGGYTIQTTIEPALQRFAKDAVLQGLVDIDTRHKRVAPFKKSRKRIPAPKGALREGQIYEGEVIGHDWEKGTIEVRVGERTGIVNFDTVERYNPKEIPIEKFAAKGARVRVSLASAPSARGVLRFRLEMGPQAALVAIRPENGAIVAMIGGDVVAPGGFNRATMAKRQPGSTFKPLPYLAAFQTGGYTAATLLDDAPEVQGEWQPQNAHADEFQGAVRIRDALARSLNLPAVKVITEVGPALTVELARRLGVTSDLEPSPALALGASAVTPLEMAGVYAVFANRGIRNPPRIIERVIRPDGTNMPLVPEPSKKVLSEQEAYLITSLLESVVKGGTGTKARELKRPVGGKTGTSNEQRDAWFVGFTPDFSCAVWVGYDDFQSIGRREYGAKAALPIWLDFMKKAHDKKPVREFEEPEGIVTLAIDPQSGLLAYEGMEEPFTEIFIDGTEPTQIAIPPDMVAPESFLMDQMADPGEADAGLPASSVANTEQSQ